MKRRVKLKCFLGGILFLALLLLLYSSPINRPIISRGCGRAKGTARYFISFRGSCYHIPKESMSWFRGLRYCLRHGLTLATLDEDVKLKLITEHCQRNNMRQEYWFGGTELGSAENDFWYVSNGQTIHYFATEGLLRERSGQHCLKLNIHWYGTHIATDSCEAVHPVICEQVE